MDSKTAEEQIRLTTTNQINTTYGEPPPGKAVHIDTYVQVLRTVSVDTSESKCYTIQ